MKIPTSERRKHQIFSLKMIFDNCKVSSKLQAYSVSKNEFHIFLVIYEICKTADFKKLLVAGFFV